MENGELKGHFRNIRAANFKYHGSKRIERILVSSDSYSSFFYPVYHIGQYRCCWGRYMTLWDRGTLDFDGRLRSIQSQFIQGASISIYFSLGLALALKENNGSYCLRLEHEYGYGTSIGDANTNFAKLRDLFMFFRKKRSTKECISWGLVNISSFGYWDKKDNNIFILYPKNWKTYESDTYSWEWRNFTQREREFIRNKLKRKIYCQDMTQPEYYYSDVYSLLNNVSDGDIGSDTLTF